MGTNRGGGWQIRNPQSAIRNPNCPFILDAGAFGVEPARADGHLPLAVTGAAQSHPELPVRVELLSAAPDQTIGREAGAPTLLRVIGVKAFPAFLAFERR